MDDELQNLEAELSALRPVRPSAALRARIERELSAAEAPARVVTPSWRIWAAALPVAAAVAVLAALAMTRAPRAPASNEKSAAVSEADGAPRLKPIAAENVLYAARDEGLVTLEDGTPARRARLSYVDTIVWENPRTNASLKWSVPREEVRIVPVSYQ